MCDTDTGVCTDGWTLGLVRDHCEIYGIDTDTCTDGCNILLEGDHCDRCDVHTAVKYDYRGRSIIDVILTQVYVPTAIKYD